MARIDVAKLVRLRIEFTVEEGHVPIRWRIVVDIPVDLGDDLPRRQAGPRVSPHRRVNRGHEQCRSRPLSRDIPDGNDLTSVALLDDVVVIPPHLTAGKADPHQIIPLDGGRIRWVEAQLKAVMCSSDTMGSPSSSFL